MKKILILIVFFALFAYGIYWLWQRQPKPKGSQPEQSPISQTKKQEPQKALFQIKPQDSSVFTSDKIKLEGKFSADTYIAIFSNESQYLVKITSQGNLEKEMALAKGLNQFQVAIISSDLKQTQNQPVTYFRTSQKDQAPNSVYDGLVKAVFDNIITLTTASGEKKVRTTQSTQIKVPSEGKTPATKSALTNIRIGDFAIALGDISQEMLTAQSLEIVRENKPQNTRKLATAKTLTSIRQNLISAKNLDDNSIVEFSLTKTSQIQKDGKEARSADIVKDKNAIIIYHPQDDKKLIDLIYLLP